MCSGVELSFVHSLFDLLKRMRTTEDTKNMASNEQHNASDYQQNSASDTDSGVISDVDGEWL